MPNYEGIAFKVIISKNFDGVVFKTVMLSGAKIMDSQINAESTWSSEHLAKLLPKGEASGSIASFDDGAGDVPLISCVADFMATQDLHGQNAPYPAGGGKNLFNVVAGTKPNIDLTINSDGSVKLNGTATTSNNFSTTYNLKAGTYTLSCPFSGNLPSTAVRVQIYNAEYSLSVGISNPDPSDTKVTFTTTDDMTIQCRIRVEGGFNYNNVILYPQLEAGSTATTFAPYSNICPIIPIDEVNITRAGKNLFGFWKNGYYTDAGVYNSNNKNGLCYPIKLAEGQAITLYATSYTSRGIAVFEDKELTRFITTKRTGNPIVYTAIKDCWVTAWINIDNTVIPDADNIKTVKTQLEYENQATDYEPYNSTTKTINLGSDYYGGSVEAVDGKINKTHQFYNSLSDGISNVVKDSNSWGVYYSNAIYESNNQYKEGICDKLAFKTSYSGVNGNNCTIAFPSSAGTQILLRNDSLTSAQEVRDFMASLEVVYPLATPIEAQAENVASISTLDGVNNIFADSGDVDVQYFLDIKKYIDNLVNPSNTRSLSAGLNLTREAPSIPDEAEEEEEESQETNEER